MRGAQDGHSVVPALRSILCGAVALACLGCGFKSPTAPTGVAGNSGSAGFLRSHHGDPSPGRAPGPCRVQRELPETLIIFRPDSRGWRLRWRWQSPRPPRGWPPEVGRSRLPRWQAEEPFMNMPLLSGAVTAAIDLPGQLLPGEYRHGNRRKPPFGPAAGRLSAMAGRMLARQTSTYGEFSGGTWDTCAA